MPPSCVFLPAVGSLSARRLRRLVSTAPAAPCQHAQASAFACRHGAVGALSAFRFVSVTKFSVCRLPCTVDYGHDGGGDQGGRARASHGGRAAYPWTGAGG